jgi:DNA invertase Pin-like site-specific DNA recombinase
MYLRKSREDIEAEKRGEGETLSKHRQILMKTAKDKSFNIIKIREEVVSGESLVHRPEMLELLKEIEQGFYEAVLCMDVDRLGRGNMQEQGLILETFKKSGTKIITPRKIYDLDDEFDEEYSEFEAFMARKELKIINRRLQRGRIRSVEDGNYISTYAPFGYEIHYTDKYRTLKPHPEQAPIVKMIYELYVSEIGANKIANKLNQLGYKTATGLNWTYSPVLNIIKNPVYIGKITWKKKRYAKSVKDGQLKEVHLQPQENWIIADGQHKPLISIDLFERAQEILKGKYHVPYNTKVTNPLASLIKCKSCGASMVYRPYTKAEPQIMCYGNCGNKSSKFKYIEERMIESLKQWLEGYKVKIESDNTELSSDMIDVQRKALKGLESEYNELINQKNNLHDLLERGIYDFDMYVERSKILADRINVAKLSIENVSNEISLAEERKAAKFEIIPMLENVLNSYYSTEDPKKKNDLLKSVLDHAEYYKEKSQRNDSFTIVLYPKLTKATPH